MLAALDAVARLRMLAVLDVVAHLQMLVALDGNLLEKRRILWRCSL